MHSTPASPVCRDQSTAGSGAEPDHARPFEPSIKSPFCQVFERFRKLLAINAHKMAPRPPQWLQDRTWDTPTKGLLWDGMRGRECNVAVSGWIGRASAVKVDTKQLPDFLFSGLLKGCKGHKTHHFENRGTNQLWKTGKREVVLCQPLPQTL